ncbi:MAG: WG repeat-containing protein [Ignavibacteriaceae bacterium]|jgi:hypothetical protein|nr:WG repeat-containing protein [Ignavibacteriaceae bacterium]
MPAEKEKLVKGPFVDGSAAIFKKNGLFIEKGLQLKDGTNVWFPDAQIGNFNDGIAWILKGEKIGFVDRIGNIIIEPKYFSATEFGDGLCIVSDIRATFLINKKEEIIAQYDEGLLAQKFCDGIAKVSQMDDDGEHFIDGIINEKGEYSIPMAIN